MKKIFLLVITILSFQYSFAQDPEIIGTWYLRGFTSDLGEIELIDNDDAPQNPTLVINPDYTFDGIAACNGFSGEFIYDAIEDVYFHENFFTTLDDCNNTNYTNFETLYFSHFDDTQGPFLRYVDIGPSRLLLEFAPGFGMEFQDTVFLGIEELLETSISIFPTMASKQIQIEFPDSLRIESLQIVNSLGQLVYQKTHDFHALDISGLNSGIYFIEMNTEKGNVIKKFIKQ